MVLSYYHHGAGGSLALAAFPAGKSLGSLHGKEDPDLGLKTQMVVEEGRKNKNNPSSRVFSNI